jgi:hypothetical protein
MFQHCDMDEKDHVAGHSMVFVVFQTPEEVGMAATRSSSECTYTINK